jgi:hypothetical protein
MSLWQFAAITLIDLWIFNLDSRWKLVHAVARLVEALRYKLESSGFDSLWCHWKCH